MGLYLSSALHSRYPAIYSAIASRVAVTKLKTPNLWIRDYLPIAAKDRPIRFQYRIRHHNLNIPKSFWPSFPFKNYLSSGIYLDGGNVEQNENTVLITEKVFADNPLLSREITAQILEARFGKRLVILPVEPDDTLGHVDGIARFARDNVVLVNDYSIMKSPAYNQYQIDLSLALSSAGMDVVTIPFAYPECPKLTMKEFRKKYPKADEYNPALGYYINFLKVSDILFLPVFCVDEDDQAISTFASLFPNHEIVPVNCAELSMEGGLLHCISWEAES
jgi:agmatine deiminase